VRWTWRWGGVNLELFGDALAYRKVCKYSVENAHSVSPQKSVIQGLERAVVRRRVPIIANRA